MKKRYTWNLEEDRSREFWDWDKQAPMFKTVNMSLKDRLNNVSGVRSENVLADIAQGIAEIMDYLEQKDKEST